MPVTDELKFITDPNNSKEQLIWAYPNPAPEGYAGPIYIKFMISKGITEVKISIFTSSMRLIRRVTAQVDDVNVDGGKEAGYCTVALSPDLIEKLSRGTYYFVIDVKNGTQSAKSKIEKIIKVN
jgi:hypothetical protein